MPTFYAPQSQAFRGFDLGSVLANAQRYRAGEEALRRSQAEEAQAAQLRPLETLGRQLALRGQILGAVETPEDYAAALPVVQAAGLPTADLPEDRRSTAWMTFRQPEAPATSQARASWMPDFGAPIAPPALPVGTMEARGIAPEDVATVQRRAQAGLPLQLQARIQDQDIGRALQREQIAANLSKYETQDALRRSQDARAAEAAQLARQKTEADIQNAQLSAQIQRAEISTAGPGGQAVTQAIKGLPDLQAAAKTALTGFNTIARMEQLLSEGAGARPGMIKVGLGRLFGYQSEDMAKAEEYQLLAETLRGPLREDIVGPGPMTEAEQRLLGQVTGGGSTGRKAAIALLNLYRENARKRIDGYNEQVRTLSQFDPRIPQVYKPVQIGGGQAAPASTQYRETRIYNGATYGRNSPSENWKLVK